MKLRECHNQKTRNIYLLIKNAIIIYRNLYSNCADNVCNIAFYVVGILVVSANFQLFRISRAREMFML